MISAPVKVPRIEPRPPLRLPPPITTAAMIGNSLPVPEVGSPIVSRLNWIQPGHAHEKPGDRVDRDPRQRQR